MCQSHQSGQSVIIVRVRFARSQNCPESPERPVCRQLSSISISIATSQVLLLTLPHSHIRRHEVAMKRIGTSKIVLASLGRASPEQVRHGQQTCRCTPTFVIEGAPSVSMKKKREERKAEWARGLRAFYSRQQSQANCCHHVPR